MYSSVPTRTMASAPLYIIVNRSTTFVIQCTVALRSHIEKSDKIFVCNIGKDKKLPGTKTQPKYFGPYDVETVTKGHVVVSKSEKSKKVPLHLTKKYLQRISKVPIQ